MNRTRWLILAAVAVLLNTGAYSCRSALSMPDPDSRTAPHLERPRAGTVAGISTATWVVYEEPSG